VVLTGRREEVLQELVRALGGERAEALPADLASADAARALVERAGRVDVLVANHALPASGRLDDYTAEEIDRALDVNLRAPIHMAHALVPGMIERGEGHLVFVSSMSGKVAAGAGSIYSATKFGLRGFALGLREDLRDRGVGVSTVFPGFIRDAGMFAEADVTLPPGTGTRTPEDVAAGVVKAIEGNRAELEIAPLGLRIGTAFAALLPEPSAHVARLLGSMRVAGEMAQGQRHKR
jgi:short-subunit dehydrogenase